jgi:hypothetical protein
VLTLESLNEHIEQCRILVAKGEEQPEELEELLQLREDLKNEDERGWAAYNELVEHLPNDDQDPLLIILKGQLLIERLITRFIVSRLPNPEPFIKLQLSSAQCIGIAESMCLSNKEPKWLWSQVKELNSIRNKLAHKLTDKSIEKRIESFVSTIANHEGLHNRTITGAISRLYGMLKGLCEVAESNEFKFFK